jgi:hypothetical protein
MENPISVDELPAEIRDIVKDAEGDYGDALDAVEDWLDGQDDRPPNVLVTIAWLEIEFALDIMVDEVTERGERALELLDEAADLKKQTAKLRRHIERCIARSRKYDREQDKAVDATLDKSLDALDRRQLRDLAYKLGRSQSADDKEKAARAWELASTHATEDYDKYDCLGRAALEFADAGRWDEAEPRLQNVIAEPTKYEGWIVDYCWYRLLDKAIAETNVAEFEKYWKGAVAMQRQDHFPYSHPSQEQYLAFALAHRLVDIARHIASVAPKNRNKREIAAIQPLLDRVQEIG